MILVVAVVVDVPQPQSLAFVMAMWEYCTENWQPRCMYLTAGAIFVPCSQVAHVILYPDSGKSLIWQSMGL